MRCISYVLPPLSLAVSQTVNTYSDLFIGWYSIMIVLNSDDTNWKQWHHANHYDNKFGVMTTLGL